MEKESIPLLEMEIHPLKGPLIKQGLVNRLAQSIAEEGLLTPLVILKTNKKYQVLSGAHRMTALKKLNYETAPCIVVNSETADTDALIKYTSFSKRTWSPWRSKRRPAPLSATKPRLLPERNGKNS